MDISVNFNPIDNYDDLYGKIKEVGFDRLDLS